VAEVVRDLTVRDRDKGLSAGEKRMLQRSRQILVSELVLACHVGEDKAVKLVDEALEG
jgi:CarD family transcriptional regulator